jgi:hypothetical protein
MSFMEFGPASHFLLLLFIDFPLLRVTVEYRYCYTSVDGLIALIAVVQIVPLLVLLTNFVSKNNE